MALRLSPGTRSAVRQGRVRATRWFRWHRRQVAALLAGLALALALLSLRPPTAPQRTLAVAARDLPAGHAVGAADLREIRVPARMVPLHALTRGRVVGRVLAGGLRRGEVVSDVRLVGAGLALAAGPGRVVAPVTLGDPLEAGLVRVGDTVTVLAASAGEQTTVAAQGTGSVTELGPGTGPGRARVVVPSARVLAVATAAGTGLLGGGPTAAGSLPLLLAVTPTQALELASAATGQRLSLVIGTGQDGSAK